MTLKPSSLTEEIELIAATFPSAIGETLVTLSLLSPTIGGTLVTSKLLSLTAEIELVLLFSSTIGAKLIFSVSTPSV